MRGVITSSTETPICNSGWSLLSGYILEFISRDKLGFRNEKLALSDFKKLDAESKSFYKPGWVRFSPLQMREEPLLMTLCRILPGRTSFRDMMSAIKCAHSAEYDFRVSALSSVEVGFSMPALTKEVSSVNLHLRCELARQQSLIDNAHMIGQWTEMDFLQNAKYTPCIYLSAARYEKFVDRQVALVLARVRLPSVEEKLRALTLLNEMTKMLYFGPNMTPDYQVILEVLYSTLKKKPHLRKDPTFVSLAEFFFDLAAMFSYTEDSGWAYQLEANAAPVIRKIARLRSNPFAHMQRVTLPKARGCHRQTKVDALNAAYADINVDYRVQ